MPVTTHLPRAQAAPYAVYPHSQQNGLEQPARNTNALGAWQCLAVPGLCGPITPPWTVLLAPWYTYSHGALGYVENYIAKVTETPSISVGMPDVAMA
jgi:hypothetical protein